MRLVGRNRRGSCVSSEALGQNGIFACVGAGEGARVVSMIASMGVCRMLYSQYDAYWRFGWISIPLLRSTRTLKGLVTVWAARKGREMVHAARFGCRRVDSFDTLGKYFQSLLLLFSQP